MQTKNWQPIVWSMVIAAVVATGIAPAATAPAKKQPKRIGTQLQLLRLLKQHQPRYNARYRTGPQAIAMNTVMPLTGAASGGSSAASDYSTTITQVTGVDEGDIVKNNGNTIYQINQGRVLVIHAYPDTEVGVRNVLDFSDSNFYPQELYLDAQFLTIVGTAFENPQVTGGVRLLTPIWFFSTSTVKAQIYDISDPANPIKVREVEVTGDYVAARKIGSSLYLVARQYPNYYALSAASNTATMKTAVPTFRDSRSGSKLQSLSLRNCYYFPGFDDPNYLVIAGLDLSNPTSLLDVNAYLGAGDQVYASLDNLYVSASRQVDYFVIRPLLTGAMGNATAARTKAAAAVSQITATTPQEQTDVYKFALNSGHSQFVAGTTIPGSILNSYSMDENNGYFRVATTEHAWWWWWNSDAQDRNHLYVLDANLNRVGGVENIAPGERIYAARFLDDRAFLVTYQNIDPLFAIDLSDPANPQIVGQLTLPGYSNFLLPYDAHHLIGFGKDVTVVDSATTGDVPWWSGGAYYQGMKIALFDVTDLRNPVQIDSVSIGDRGTESAALWDPHALLFDRAKGVLAFPISVAQITDPDPMCPWLWGDTIFQGAYVYNVSPETGFQFKGAITHKPAGQDIWDTWGNEINRLLYIGSDLYTLSDTQLKVNHLDTLADITALALPQPPPDPITIDPPLIFPGPIVFGTMNGTITLMR